MRKTENKDYRSYIIATVNPTKHLDGINRLGGRIYSKTVSLTQKTHDTKGFWLSESEVAPMGIRGVYAYDNLQSESRGYQS